MIRDAATLADFCGWSSVAGVCFSKLAQVLIQRRRAIQNCSALVPVVKFDRGHTLVLRKLAACKTLGIAARGSGATSLAWCIAETPSESHDSK